MMQRRLVEIGAGQVFNRNQRKRREQLDIQCLEEPAAGAAKLESPSWLLAVGHNGREVLASLAAVNALVDGLAPRAGAESAAQQALS